MRQFMLVIHAMDVEVIQLKELDIIALNASILTSVKFAKRNMAANTIMLS